MSRLITVADLITRVQNESDDDNSDWPGTGQIQRAISVARAEMIERVLQAGVPVGETTATISGAGATTSALPSDWWGTLKLERLLSGTTYYEPLRRIQPLDDYRYEGLGGYPLVWRISAGNLLILPAPQTGVTLRHTYIAQPADLSSVVTSTTVDTINGTGERLIVLGATIFCKRKEESPTAELEAKLERLFEQFVGALQTQYMTEGTLIRWVGPLGVEASSGLNYHEPGDWGRWG